MARVNRSEQLDPEAVEIAHVYNRLVRRCLLMGDDPITGNNYDYRKDWVENMMQVQVGSVKILDETGLLACAAYVDLNPIRAALCEVLEESDYTSAQRRISTLLLEQVTEAESQQPAILQRLGLDGQAWCELVRDFSELFSTVAARPAVIDAARSHRRFHTTPRLRKLIGG